MVCSRPAPGRADGCSPAGRPAAQLTPSPSTSRRDQTTLPGTCPSPATSRSRAPTPGSHTCERPAAPPGPRLRKTPGGDHSPRRAGGGGRISAAAGAREQTGRHVRSRGALTPTPPQGSRTKTDVSEPAGTGSEVRGQGRRRPRECRGPPAELWHCGVRTRRPPCGPRQGPSWAAGAGPVGRSPAERRHSTWRQPLLTGRGRRGTHGASASGPSSGTLRGSPGLLRAASGANLTAGPDAKLGGSCSPALPNSQQGRGRVDAWGALRSRDLSGMWKTHLKSTGTAVKWPSGKAAWSRTQRRRPLPQCSGLSPGGEDGAVGYLGESYCPVSAC